jgi:predicted phage-related endonuclease
MNTQRTIHNVQQGSDAWLSLRAGYFTASEAPAMMGVSKHMKRNELLHAKHTMMPREFSEFVQRHVLDRGHAAETAARPLAEELVGSELYPVTATIEVDGLRLLASLDGLNMAETIAWETKLWNEELAAAVRAGELPEHFTVQMDQELLVSGASRCLFTCSDGTPDHTVSLWYESSQEKFDAIIAGWAQFAADLAAYTPPEVVEKVTAEVVADLPAVAVRMDGALVVHSNLAVFGEALRAYIERIPSKPSTDQEFAEAEQAVKTLQKAEDALDAAESGALASISDVNEMQRLAASLRELSKRTRLALNKSVTTRKEQIREEIVRDARLAFGRHVDALQAELEGVTLALTYPDFAGAIKGKRTIDSLRDAADTALAQGKIAADTRAREIRASLAAFNAEAANHLFLFADRLQLVQKPAEDVRTLVAARIAKHQADEAARLEAERERIRAEEQAKAQREAAAAAERAESERRAAEIAAAAKNIEAQPPQQVLKAEPATADATDRGTAAITSPRVGAMGTRATADAAPSEAATLKLGTICDRLGFTLTASFLADTLGITHSATDKAAKLYRPSDFERICAALVEHIARVSDPVTA